MYSQARSIHEELGRHFRVATVASLIAAEIEQLADQPDEAVSILRWSFDTVRQMGAMSATATIAGFFADTLSVAGRRTEALEISSFAEQHAPESDVVVQVLWRMARARPLAEQDPTAAGDLARDALARARDTDWPDLQARALVCLAHVIGPGDEQSSSFAEAREVWERKGNVAAVARLPIGSVHPA